MKKLTGLLLVTVMAGALFAVLATAALAADSNTGGVVVESGDAPDCVGGSCGGVIVEDPAGSGPDCTGGNCGGSVCAGSDCGTCTGGNCGGSISGSGEEDHGKAKQEMGHAKPSGRALPRTGIPTAATLALGAGMILVGLFFTFVEHPATKTAVAAMSYRPKRRL
jgi:hypothetical protein